MILIVLVAALAFALFVTQRYVTSDTYSRKHRLLPLVLGLIALTDFYEIVEYLTGEGDVFSFLERLLLVQMLYVIIYYMLDILEKQLVYWQKALMYSSLILTDVTMFLEHSRHRAIYEYVFETATVVYVSAIIYLASKAYVYFAYNRKEHYVNLLLYLALMTPCVGLVWQRAVVSQWSEVIVPVCLACTCAIVYYLISTTQLVDNMTLLQENLYDTSDIAVVLFDEDYYYLDANEAARQLFPDELGLAPKGRGRHSCAKQLQPLLDNPDEPLEIAVRGGEFYQCSLQPVAYHARQKGFILSIVNITRQKRETKLMEQLKEMAQEQTASKSRFLACMSHDLRSPLHAIIGISDIMLARQELDGRNRSLVRYVKGAGNMLLELVDSILVFSKLEAGKLELHNRAYDMDKLLEELTNMCVVNLHNRPVKFSIAFRSAHPSLFYGDPVRVEQMLQNLLSNAVKYTEKGEIRCELTCQQQGKRYLLYCRVLDTGSGMTKEQLAHIFDEYASYSQEHRLEGTGLGLCIVKQLAEMMGGEAYAESDGNNGSILRFFIYQEAMPQAELRQPVTFNETLLQRRQLQASEAIVPRWIYPQAKVLLADDMKVNQEIFKELLRVWRFQIDVADGGQRAIEMAQKEDYQLIFLDMVMPDMSGLDVAKTLRRGQKTPMVLVTASLNPEIEQTYHMYGFHAMLVKPIDTARLKELIEALMPKEYRLEPKAPDTVRLIENLGYEGNRRGYRRMLEAFVQEVEPLLGELRGYASGDRMMFQTKVHGIKGASLQIGESALSEQAEIMEMAAKTDNERYIDRHIGYFIEELENSLAQVRNELARMTFDTDTVTPKQQESSPEELFAALREAFESYDMAHIEEKLRLLHTLTLPPEQSRLLEKVQAAYDELEYEQGAELLWDK